MKPFKKFAELILARGFNTNIFLSQAALFTMMPMRIAIWLCALHSLHSQVASKHMNFSYENYKL